MSSITEQNNLGDLLKYEASSLYSRDQITVAKGQNLKLGTVVGRDKDNMIRIINPTATDGIQTAIGAIVSDVNATENAKAVIITRSALLADYAVVWPANITEEQKNAIKQQCLPASESLKWAGSTGVVPPSHGRSMLSSYYNCVSFDE